MGIRRVQGGVLGSDIAGVARIQGGALADLQGIARVQGGQLVDVWVAFKSFTQRWGPGEHGITVPKGANQAKIVVRGADAGSGGTGGQSGRSFQAPRADPNRKGVPGRGATSDRRGGSGSAGGTYFSSQNLRQYTGGGGQGGEAASRPKNTVVSLLNSTLATALAGIPGYGGNGSSAAIRSGVAYGRGGVGEGSPSATPHTGIGAAGTAGTDGQRVEQTIEVTPGQILTLVVDAATSGGRGGRNGGNSALDRTTNPPALPNTYGADGAAGAVDGFVEITWERV